MLKLNGIIAAMTTPLTMEEKVNEQELRNQVNRFIKAGIHSLFCLGTNGEFYALSFEEKLKVISIVVDETKGRVPVLAGTGCITTKETIELTKKAKELGVDAVSVISPYFAGCSQEVLYNHFSTLADSVDIPIILYNIPARTGVNIDYTTVARLAKIKNIVGIKDSSGNFDNVLRYIEETPEDFIVLSGNDSLILWTLMAGGNGGISGISNILPEIMVSIYEEWKKGDFKKSKKAQDSIREIRDTLKFGNPNSIVKFATNLVGNPVGPAKAPFNVDSKKIEVKLLKVLELYK
ncbi:4-hydroxy-tetrahydrodipicolinate synthase [Clostridium estertheticum]|uniref:4-hydroxy-tetrahydrodipicolinate synthase n=1 Tax=Clostridium estertheticum TaxID=238834 RepID=A0AA47EEZ9_9CLOT|nr:4-hydroxy-tetrahydrodipicolinate synthase [Clostridium estertheticum]MBU3154976.1 4-hydroxy-tetrahydrodipicolinate synthase [Clostridium estertheticum]WAG58796.1 4-hydroxy-tetrahydrodipicolinate synthase [Clostridium estertheticum]